LSTANSLSGKAKKFGWHFVHKLTGIHLSTPTRYFDWSVMSASFPAPVSNLQEKLPKGLVAVEFEPATITIILRAIEVRKAQGLSPYNEFAVEVPVMYQKTAVDKGLPGSYVLYMPVTSEEARWGGVEIVGLPKFIAEINFEETDEIRQCNVQANKKTIVTLEVQKLTPESQAWDWYIYGVRDGKLLRTHLACKGQRGLSNTKAGASFSLGNHPIADELRALKIGNASTASEYAPMLESIEDRPAEV
jgi:hypothetical protein